MVKKFLKWISNVLLAFFILVIVFTGISMFQTKRDPNRIVSILGYKPLTVLSGSMSPLLEPGDMVVVTEIDPTKVKEGDVIPYRIDQSTLVTHRVIEVIKEENSLMFRTRGDANNTEDQELVEASQLVGKMSFKIPYGGYVTNFIRSPKGFILFILLPAVLLIIGEMRSILVSQLMEEQKKEEGKNKNMKI